jgi:hypothetical protein
MRWLMTSSDLNVNMTTFQIHNVELMSHFGDGYVWHVTVKCTGLAVNLDVHLVFVLLWQHHMLKDFSYNNFYV